MYSFYTWLPNFANKSEFQLFEEPSEVMAFKSVKVIQTYSNGMAVAEDNDTKVGDKLFLGTTYVILLQKENKEPYYDGQIVRTLSGKNFVQVGIYRTKAKNGEVKNYPVVTQLGKNDVWKKP